jgi:histidinol-phosphate aminotransferase
VVDYPVRPEVLKLQPYIPGKPIAEVQQEYGVTDIVKLASNENPLGPSPLAIAAVRKAVAEVHIYPEPTAPHLRAKLAAHVGLPADWIMVGNGSDEIVRLLAASYIQTNDRVVMPGCSFPNYRVMSQMFGAVIDEVPLKDETMDLERMAALAPGARMLFLCRPNNPTGGVFTAAAFRRFMAAVPLETLVLLDQAYYEFDDSPFDAIALLPQYPNLVITRTFSKAYGLAGFRIGYGMAHPGLLKALFMVREPFSVNVLAQVAAVAALEDTAHLAATLANNRAGKAFLVALCDKLGLSYIPSQGNFLMIDVGQPAGQVFEALLKLGVIIRPVGGRPKFIRVTIGLPSENERFATALKQTL